MLIITKDLSKVSVSISLLYALDDTDFDIFPLKEMRLSLLKDLTFYV